MGQAKRYTYERDGRTYSRNSAGKEIDEGVTQGGNASGDKSDDDSGLSATKKKELQTTSGLGALAKRNKARKKAAKDLDNKPPKKDKENKLKF